MYFLSFFLLGLLNALFLPFAYFKLLAHNFKSKKPFEFLIVLLLYPFISLALLAVDFLLNAKYCFSKPLLLKNKNQSPDKPIRDEDFTLVRSILDQYQGNTTQSVPIRKVILELRSKMKFTCCFKDIAHLAKKSQTNLQHRVLKTEGS